MCDATKFLKLCVAMLQEQLIISCSTCTLPSLQMGLKDETLSGHDLKWAYSDGPTGDTFFEKKNMKRTGDTFVPIESIQFFEQTIHNWATATGGLPINFRF